MHAIRVLWAATFRAPVRVDGEDPVELPRGAEPDGFLVVGSLPHRGREARDIDLLRPWRDAEDETALVDMWAELSRYEKMSRVADKPGELLSSSGMTAFI